MPTTVDELRAEIAAAAQKIKVIQNECSHPLSARTTTPRGNTGNYDPGADSYWTEHHCGLCDRSWRTDQDWRHSATNPRGVPEPHEI